MLQHVTHKHAIAGGIDSAPANTKAVVSKGKIQLSHVCTGFKPLLAYYQSTSNVLLKFTDNVAVN